jgi:transcriptional regulator with XRE-family HTH domain
MMTTLKQMYTTEDLAKRLGISVTTIERLRSTNSPDLPPCITIGKSKRYDEQLVEQFIRDQSCASKHKITQSSIDASDAVCNAISI